jgi:1-acyl-sn-glycerol-3-phosphate acyltransferase
MSTLDRDDTCTAVARESATRDWARSRPLSLVRCAFQDGVLVPAMRAYCTPFRAVQSDAAPRLDGPLLIVANHASHLDTPAILAALPPRIRHRTAVAAAADYFYKHHLVGAAASLSIGTFAFPRHGRQGIEHAAALLADGWNVLVFPQGSRGADDAWLPFRHGVGHLLAVTGVAVLPVAIRGSRALWPRGQRLPRRGRIDVQLGQVWQPAPQMRPPAIAAELERRVQEILG